MQSTECSESWSQNYFYSPASRKSRLVTFLLAFFFGMFGAHRFYVGKTGTAFVQLILSLTVFGMVISGPWVVIDWVMIICGSFKDNWGARLPAGLTSMEAFFTRRTSTTFHMLGAYTFGEIMARAHGWQVLLACLGYLALVCLASLIAVYLTN